MFNKFFAAVAVMACVALVSNSAQAQIGEGNYPNHLFAHIRAIDASRDALRAPTQPLQLLQRQQLLWWWPIVEHHFGTLAKQPSGFPPASIGQPIPF